MPDATKSSDATLGTQDDSFQYWGFLFQRNKAPSDKLDRLLRGIAACITAKHPSPDGPDLLPSQLASFYRDVGGSYDDLFTNQPPQSIAFIYRCLGCLHSLQPDFTKHDLYSTPCVPALKPRGFVTWQTIQLLLGPQEHVPYIQAALRAYDVVDPVTKSTFPKSISPACFPTHADPEMEKWHDSVTDRLRGEAEDAAADEERGHLVEVGHHHSRPVSAVESPATPGDGVSRYFTDPRHHGSNHDERPKIYRTISKAAPQQLKDGGKAVALTVRNIANPYLWSGHGGSNEHVRSSSRSRRHSRDNRGSDISENGELNIPPPHSSHSSSRPSMRHRSVTPSKHQNPLHVHRNSTHGRPHRSRRSRSLSADRSDASSDNGKHSSERRRKPRRHRSHDPSTGEKTTMRDHDTERPSSQYLSDMGNGSSQSRRKSHDEGRSHRPRERAQTSGSDSFRTSEGSRPLPPDQVPRGHHQQHRASVSHYRPTQGYMPANDAHHPAKSPTSSRHSSAAFKDPFRPGSGIPGDSGMNATSPPSSAVSSAATSPPDSRPQFSHRYVTPVNGVKGRQYPNDAAFAGGRNPRSGEREPT